MVAHAGKKAAIGANLSNELEFSEILSTEKNTFLLSAWINRNVFFLTSSMRHPEQPDWMNLFISVLRALFFQH